MSKPAWISGSIMEMRGSARGKSGAHHALSEARQGKFHYVYGPYAKPVLEIEPGDSISVETQDAFGGALKSEQDKPSQKLKFPYLNPQSGPDLSCRAPRRAIALPCTSRPWRHAAINRPARPASFRNSAASWATSATAMLNPALPERVKKMRIDEAGVHWNEKIVLPYEPFIGTIGVSPEIEAISSLQPDYHGGNMDLPDIGPGAILYLPMHTRGALLYLGDCHATQGDGELCGVAVEQAATVDGPRRAHQRLELCLASARDGKLHHDDRQRPPARGCGAHRVSRAHPLDGRRLRLRRARRVFVSYPGRTHPPRQHGRSEIYHRRLRPEKIRQRLSIRDARAKLHPPFVSAPPGCRHPARSASRLDRRRRDRIDPEIAIGHPRPELSATSGSVSAVKRKTASIC